MKKRSSLERKMLSYFGLIAAASLLITIEFLWAIRVTTPQTEQDLVMQSGVEPIDESFDRRGLVAGGFERGDELQVRHGRSLPSRDLG